MNSLQFNNTSISSSYFQIENVITDNACFYRALSNSLAFSHSSFQSHDILKNLEFDTYKTISEFFNNIHWGKDGPEQEILAKELQKIVHTFVLNNDRNMIIPIDEAIGLSLEDLINITHNISYDKYVTIYKFFSGELVIDSNLNILKERWGGFFEQLVLSYIFKVPIITLIPFTYSFRYNKIIY